MHITPRRKRFVIWGELLLIMALAVSLTLNIECWL